MSISFAQNQMSSFVRGTQMLQIKRAFQFICKSQHPKQGQQILDKFKNKSNYCVILSNFLDISNVPEINSKILAALQLKNLQIIQQQQCWWILSNVYLNQNQKLSHIVKQICLKQQHIYFLRPFFEQNYQFKAQLPKIRLLQLFFDFIFNKNEKIAIQFIQTYYKDILNCLAQIDSQNVQFQRIAQLLMVNYFGLFNSYKIYFRYKFQLNWIYILDQVKCKNSNAITNVLSQIFKIQMNLHEIKDFNTVQQAIRICLKQTQKNCVFQQNQFYFNLLNIINMYFFRQQISQDQEFLKNIFATYLFYVKRSINKTILYLQDNLHQQEDDYATRKFCILQSLVKKTNVLLIKRVLAQFQINMLQFSIVIPFFSQIAYINQICLIQACRFIKQMGERNPEFNYQHQKYIILVTFKYISKYSKNIPIQLLLQICYIADQIAIKYLSLAGNCYQIIQILSSELLSIQTYKILQFLNKSLKNVNQNIYGHTEKSYLFIFNILLNIDEEFWIDKQQQLNSNLIKMVEILANILNEQYNHQTMQKLLQFLQILTKKENTNILGKISQNSLKTIANLYFQFQIVDFHQFQQQKSSFILTLYQHFKSELYTKISI